MRLNDMWQGQAAPAGAPSRGGGTREFLRAATLALIVAAVSGAVGWGIASLLDGRESVQSEAPAALKERVARSYGKLPMRFEANRGQTASQVKFLSQGPGYSLFLTPREAVLSLTKNVAGGKGSGEPTRAVVRMSLLGASGAPKLEAEERLRGVSNYLVGKDKSNWQTGVPGFSQVRYRQAYPGIDLVFHGKQRQLEYDFVVAPRRDPGKIALSFRGAERLALDRSGDLLLHTRAGTLRQRRPVAYQEIGGVRRKVASRYVLEDGKRVGFKLGAYDRSRPLVIDPVLSYSTYLGSLTRSFQHSLSIAADSSGHAYVAGDIQGFQGVNGYPTKPSAPTGFRELFVTKLSQDGTELLYSTVVGSVGNLDFGWNGRKGDIAVDSSGRAYVTGQATGEFPVTANAFAEEPTETKGAFISVLNPEGSGLVYSSRLPGADDGSGIAVDLAGNAYVTGRTTSTALPARAGGSAIAFQSNLAGDADAYVAKFNPGAASGDSSLVYATYLGGTNEDTGGRIAVDRSGNAYIVGTTASADLPIQSGFQTALGGLDDNFVAKLNSRGSALFYSTYLGGGHEEGRGTGIATAAAIAVDFSGGAYVTGYTRSNDFPTRNAFQDARVTSEDGTCTPARCADAFVAKLDPAESGPASLVYSSYLGGVRDDAAHGAGVDSAGGLYLTGVTGSEDFPTLQPFAPKGVVTPPYGARPAYGDAFVARVKPDGSGLSFSSYLGGGGWERGNDLHVDSSGRAYLVGETYSSDLPTTQNAFQSSFPSDDPGAMFGAGSWNRTTQFVAKLAPDDPQGPLVLGLSTRSAPSEGGKTVVISGSGFTGASGVRFGSVPARSFSVDSDTQITAVSPAHAIGPAPVVVTRGGKDSAPRNPIATVAVGDGHFSPTSPLITGRSRTNAVRLANGKVLVAGGASAGPLGFTLPSIGTGLVSSELYDPQAGTWAPTGPLNTARCAATMTALPNGKVLIAGGSPVCNGDVAASGSLNSAELYDPTTGRWTATAPMGEARVQHSATLLQNGKVLVASGRTAELYDPENGTWSPTGALADTDGRLNHGATLLSGAACAGSAPPSYCGKVLLVGGIAVETPGLPHHNLTRTSAELYDPATRTFSLTGALAVNRGQITAVSLPDGSVLVAGGCGGGLDGCHTSPITTRATAERYNPVTGTWSPTGSMHAFRRDYAATLLPNGRVLIVGGVHTSTILNSAEAYDPASGSFRSAGVMSRHRENPFAVALSSSGACGANCGKALVGGDVRQAGATTELYTPGPAGSAGPPAGPGGGGGGGGGNNPRPPEQVAPPAFADCPTATANIIRGTAANNSIVGTRLADRIFAGTGNDTVDGLAANDCIDLGPGTDSGQGGAGSDLVVGGLGADRMSGNEGNDRLRGGSSGDRLIGGLGNDTLHGQSGTDRINGERGRDRINGGSSNDVISAGSSNDRIAGDQGGDKISGNSGNDSLLGNSGRDRLKGSSGRDRLSGGSGNDSISARDRQVDRINCGSGRDKVTADRIDRVSGNCERVSRPRRATR